MKKLIIAVDFDGTCVTHAFPGMGHEIGAAPVLKELTDAGHWLILYTMRSNNGDLPLVTPAGIEYVNGDWLDHAVEWFKQHNIPLFAIQKNPTQSGWTTSPKCYAELYIDDAALGCPLKVDPTLSRHPFVDWVAVRKYLVERNLL